MENLFYKVSQMYPGIKAELVPTSEGYTVFIDHKFGCLGSFGFGMLMKFPKEGQDETKLHSLFQAAEDKKKSMIDSLCSFFTAYNSIVRDNESPVDSLESIEKVMRAEQNRWYRSSIIGENNG